MPPSSAEAARGNALGQAARATVARARRPGTKSQTAYATQRVASQAATSPYAHKGVLLSDTCQRGRGNGSPLSERLRHLWTVSFSTPARRATSATPRGAQYGSGELGIIGRPLR